MLLHPPPRCLGKAIKKGHELRRRVLRTPALPRKQGPTYRVSLPKYPSKDPHYRILAHQRSRFTHYYFYIRDEALESAPTSARLCDSSCQ